MSSEAINKFLDIGQKIIATSNEFGAEEVQLYFKRSKEIGTRFGESHITQNFSTDLTTLQLSMIIDKKQGRTSVNISKDTDITDLVSNCVALTKLSQPSTDFPGFTTDKIIIPHDFQRKLNPIDAEYISDSITTIINTARAEDSKVRSVAGNIDSFLDEIVYLNSHGIEGWFLKPKISAVINVASKSSTASEFESRSSINLAGASINDLSLELNTKDVVNKSIKGLNPSSIEIGSYEAILAPNAVAQLLQFISSACGSDGIYSQTSFLRDSLGDKIFSEHMSIKDEISNPSFFVSQPFDFEGVTSNSIDVFDKGVFKEISFNRYYAKKFDTVSNGRSVLIFGEESPFFSSFHLQGNKATSEEDLIGQVENGVYITNLFYNNFVNAPEGLCTGLTKDGLFKIEKGELTGSLTNMRWTDNLKSIFEDITLSNNEIQIPHPFIPYVALTPSIKTSKFTFSSKGKH